MELVQLTDISELYEFMIVRCIRALNRAYAIDATFVANKIYATSQPNCIKRLAQRVFNAIWAYIDHVVHQVLNNSALTLTLSEKGSVYLIEVLKRAYDCEPYMDNFGLIQRIIPFSVNSYQ
jgi:hypothetical protein